jgi:hypothetical protein
MNTQPDTIKILEMLDDPLSHLNQSSFSELKENLIQRINTITTYDDHGEVWNYEDL